MEALADIIIRPKRANYNSNRDFGPKQFYVGGKSKQRIDFDLTNTFNQKLKCSLFAPSNPNNKYPCVIYCHGNSGCRTEALEAVDLLLPHNIIVATLDFSGSGLSGGKFVTLGYNEQEDLKCLVNHLRTIPYISEIGLWGKSMGASTCIMYASTDPSISAMCLDSAFASLTQLCTDTLRSKTLGTLVGGMFLASMKKIIQKKANFDIEEVSPISRLPQCRMPALLLHGIKDKTVPITHFRMLSMKYPGSSKSHEINIDHDEPRPKWLKQEIKTFFIQKFTEARKKQEFKNKMNLALNQKLDNPNIDHQKMEEIFNKLVDGQPDPSPSCITNTEPSSSQDLSERKKGTMTRSSSAQRLRSSKTSMNTLQLSTGTPSPFTLPDEKYKAATTKNRDISHVKLSFLLNSGGDRQDSPKVDLRAHKQFLKKSFK